MTLGEKIREARRTCALSQEQLAEKMCVSRSAVAKWETDKGLPDVGNLKVLSRLLNVSVDYLLDEAQEADGSVVCQMYNLHSYGRGCKKVKKDRVICEKFPDAKIYPLLGRQKQTEPEESLGNTLGVCADALFGATEYIGSRKNSDKEFYLVERDGQQFFVTVTDTVIQTRLMEPPLSDSQFSLDGWDFIKSHYEVKAD